MRPFFSLLGALGLLYILQDYGFQRLGEDIGEAGWFSLVLVLTFVPTLLCYSLAWLCVTELESSSLGNLKRVWVFFRMSASSIAWNNLTPFLKVGGEPAKVFMLAKYVHKADALESVVLYNIVHLLGTLGAIILTCVLLPIVFSVTPDVKIGCYVLGGIGICLFVILFKGPDWGARRLRMRQGGQFKKVILYSRWTLQRTARFYRTHPKRLVCSVILEVVARYIEGLTFYLGFWLIEKPITLLTSAFLDVGRTLLDNIFFFIPYQVGSREGGVLILMRDIFSVSPDGYLTAVFMYRFVEIVWILVGYLFWVQSKSPNRLLEKNYAPA